VNTIGPTRVLADQLRPLPRQVAQLAYRTRGDKAAAQQPMLQQLRNPFRIAHIGLASGHLLQMPRVDQQQREPALQDVPDRLPQYTRGFEGHMRHAQRLQVVGQRPQVSGHGPEGADLPEQSPGFLATADGTLDALEMHVQPGYLDKQRVHGAPPKEAYRRGTSRSVTFCSACSPTVGGNNPGYVSTSGPDSVTGLRAPVYVGLRPDDRLQRHETRFARPCHAPFSYSRVPPGGMSDSVPRTRYSVHSSGIRDIPVSADQRSIRRWGADPVFLRVPITTLLLSRAS